jgi:3-oxoacyl-[acyl-carrier protein] reductase
VANLTNKTALVTGASRGIGRATALALAETGAHILAHFGRSAQEAESLVSEIQTKGGSANAISADLGTPNGAALLAKQARSIVGDRLDVLVLNAGVSKATRVRIPSGTPIQWFRGELSTLCLTTGPEIVSSVTLTN